MKSKIDEMKKAISDATERAARDLFSSGERFYYFSLVTSGEAHAPVISAWSFERLEAFSDSEQEIIKWSYADSPYFEFGAEYFEDVRKLFSARPELSNLSGRERQEEYDMRLLVMELALRELDSKKLFGVGIAREKILINVEVMPPDYTNTDRAKRLNPPLALAGWLAEAAE